MKTRREERQLHMGGMDNEKRAFGIKNNAKMFRILSDQLYSNKPAAIIRELGCNAWDSHVAAGNTTKPFKVHAPTAIEPWFSIRDFGTGLSHDDIMTLYTTYGESTKDNSNDFIGALGLGSKSPFAYTDSFTVTSYFDGVTRMYNAYISEEGQPTITLVNMKDSPYVPNGIQIEIPIENKDFTNFYSEIVKFYSYLPLWPDITGANIERKKLVFKLKGKNWGFLDTSNGSVRSGGYSTYGYSSQGSTICMMGNVPYPLDYNAIRNSVPSEMYRSFFDPLSRRSVMLYFELGDLDIAASREALSYDKETVNNIISRVKEVQAELLSELENEIANSKTEWEARANVANNKSLYKLFNDDKAKITWQGKEILINHTNIKASAGSSTVTPNNPEPLIVYHIPAYRLRYKTLSYQDNTVRSDITDGLTYVKCDPSSKTLFIYLDAYKDHKRVPSRTLTALQKIQQDLEDKADTKYSDFYVVEGPRTKFDNLLKDLGSPPDTLDWNDTNFPDIPKAQRAGNKGTVVSLKKFSYRGRYSYQEAEHWQATSLATDLDNESGYYVDLRNNTPVYLADDREVLGTYSSSALDNLMDMCRAIKLIDASFVIYGVPGSVKNHMKDHPNWTNFFDYVKDNVNKEMNSADFKAKVEAINIYEGSREFIGSYLYKLIKSKYNTPKDLREFLEWLDENKVKSNGFSVRSYRNIVNELYALTPKLDITRNAVDTEPVGMYTHKVVNKYPLLFALDNRAEVLTNLDSEIISYVTETNIGD